MKKQKKAISLFLVLFMVFNLIICSSNNNLYETKAEVVTNDVQPITILEIQPGRSFELTKASLETAFSGKKIELVQMSMPLFISTNEYINGKYDIIYIGDKVESRVVNQVTYTDIKAASGQKVTPVTVQIDYSKEGSKITNFDFRNTTSGDYNLTKYNYNANQYESENDITLKKAGSPLLPEQQSYSVEAGLKAFIQSKQLAIMSDLIFTKTSLRETKLYQNFIGYRNNSNYPNFKLVNTNSNDTITATKVRDWYNDNSSKKRPTVTLKAKPTEFTGVNNDSSYLDNSLINFAFDVVNGNGTSSPMKVKLYLDVDGDSLFKQIECVKELTINGTSTGNTLDYRINDNFYGIMPWKLEVTDTATGAKSYRMGNFAIKGKPLEIRLLQLIPSGNKLNIDEMTQPLYASEKYIINVTRMSITEFNNSYANKTYKGVADVVQTYTSSGVKSRKTSETVSTTLNGNYDMILLGFNDTYNRHNIAETDEVANAIKSFIATGQSLMFTHDTIGGHRNWGFSNTSYFRDIAGLSRFADRFNPTGINPDGTLIPHETAITTGNEGFTNTVLHGGGTRTKSTRKLNGGVITEYPYKLSDIEVAITHMQWQQINMEDEDVIPWYTLVQPTSAVEGTIQNIIDSDDARNSYYTYSKGNVTFSGTGHAAPGGAPEQQLFINTIIKASRSANHAPTVKIYNLSNDQIITKSQSSLDFTFEVNDIDLDDLISADIYINNSKVGSTITGIKSGVTTPVSIPQATLSNIIGTASTFTVKVVAKDKKNAEGKDEVGLKYTYNLHTANIVSDKPSYGVLLNDTLEVNLTITATKGDKIATNLQIIKPSNTTNGLTSNYDSAALNLVSGGSWNIGNVEFNQNGDPNPATQANKLTFKAIKEGSYTVTNGFSYKFDNLLSGQVQNKTTSYPIVVKSGSIDVAVTGITKPVTIKLLKGGSVVSTANTVNGIVSFNGLSTGAYTVTADPQTAYVISNNNQIANLSFNNPNSKITIGFNAQKPATPVLSPSTTQPTNQDVIVTATFNGEPVQEISRDNGLTWQPYTGPITVSENGTIILARAKNQADVYSDIAQLQISNIDRTPPTANVSYKTSDGNSYNPNNWTNKNVTASLTGFNKENVTVKIKVGSAIVQQTVSGTSGAPVTYTFEIPDNTEATPNIIFILRDAAGNEAEVAASAKIDKKTPEYSIRYKTSDNSVYNPSNWTNKNVTVEFYNFDEDNVTVKFGNGSSQGIVEYTDTNNRKVVAYTIIVNQGQEVTPSIPFIITDRAGNSKEDTASAKIDKILPTADVQYTDNSDRTRTAKAVNLSEPVTFTNPTSGADVYTFTAQGTFDFMFVDKAGNIGTVLAEANGTDTDSTPGGGGDVFNER